MHITAPSSRSDDQRSIRQARAYSTFLPVDATSSRHVANTESQRLDLGLLGTNSAHHIGLNTTGFSPSIFLDDTQLALTVLESQIITSSLARASLPLNSEDCEQETPQPRRPQGSLHFAAPPSGFSFGDDSSSVIGSRKRPQSQYDQRPTAQSLRKTDIPLLDEIEALPLDDHLSNARKRQRQTANSPSSPFVPLLEDQDWTIGYVGGPQSVDEQHSTPTKRNTDHELHSSPQAPSSSSRGDDIPSQLPSTYSLSDVTSPSKGSSYIHGLPQTSPEHSSPVTPSRRPRYLRTEITSSPLPTSDHIVDTSPLPATLLHIANEEARESATPTTEAVPSSSTSHRASSLLSKDRIIRKDNAPSIVVPNTPFRSTSGHKEQGLLSSSAPVPETLMPPPPRRVLDPTTPSATASELATFGTLSFCINPAPPPTTSSSFQTHVTPNLKSLLKKYPSGEDIASRYNPRHISRTIRKSERGYWSIHPRDWSLQQQIKFWGLLEEFVGSGKAGWGVWCTREPEAGNALTKQIDPTASGLGQVKVFCWGEVVMHVYLALFVTSNSRVRRATPLWIDAEGEVVVRMQ